MTDSHSSISSELQKALRDLKKRTALDEVWCNLTIDHPTLPTDEISALLEMTPTSITEIGSLIYQDRNYSIKADRTFWRLNTKTIVASKKIEKHLQWLLQQLFGKLPVIRRLQQEGATLEIKACISPHSHFLAIDLSETVIKKLAQMRVSLEFQYHSPLIAKSTTR